jgi:hypothetical protein
MLDHFPISQIWLNSRWIFDESILAALPSIPSSSPKVVSSKFRQHSQSAPVANDYVITRYDWSADHVGDRPGQRSRAAMA